MAGVDGFGRREPLGSRAAEDEARDAADIVTACLFCTWTYSGSAAEARKEALLHRREAHPDAKPLAGHKKPHLGRFKQPTLDPEERALVEYERQRRARLHGLSLDS